MLGEGAQRKPTSTTAVPRAMPSNETSAASSGSSRNSLYRWCISMRVRSGAVPESGSRVFRYRPSRPTQAWLDANSGDVAGMLGEGAEIVESDVSTEPCGSAAATTSASIPRRGGSAPAYLIAGIKLRSSRQWAARSRERTRAAGGPQRAPAPAPSAPDSAAPPPTLPPTAA